MKGKTIALLFTSLTLIVLLILATQNNPFDSSERETEIILGDEAKHLQSNNINGSEENISESSEQADVKADVVIRSERVDVINNSPAYELKVFFEENTLSETYIRIEYIDKGNLVEKIIEEHDIPEIKDIFERREKLLEHDSEKEEGYRVKEAYINDIYLKVYIVVESEVYSEGVNTSIYCYDLNTSSVKNMFSANGDFTRLGLTENGKYMGFSYKDLLTSSINQETSLLQIVDCEVNDMLVKESRRKDSETIGKNRNHEFVYSYSFVSWESDTIARLSEEVLKKDGETGDEEISEKKEVLYHVVDNLFLSLDGSPIQYNDYEDDTQEEKADEGIVEQEKRGARSALEEFYTCISKADASEYNTAMDLLDESFVLQMMMFKQFGVGEIKKSDIDVGSVSLYMEMLKKAKLKRIINEENKEGSSIIEYVQAFSMSDESEIEQKLTAVINKFEDGWKIVSIKE